MNSLEGIVHNIKSSGQICLIEVMVNEDIFSSVIIKNSGDLIATGKKVTLLFKETEVGIAVNFKGKISLKNNLACQVTEITRGKILSLIHLNYKGNKVTSIITTSSVDHLELKEGLEVMAFIKTNELMIMEKSEV